MAQNADSAYRGDQKIKIISLSNC